MLQELQELEVMSLNLSSQFMLTAGAIMLAVGLFVWLGGMRWRWVTAMAVGVAAGAVCILFISGSYHLQGFIISGAVGFSFVMLFKKRSMVLVGAILTSLICAAFLQGEPVKAIETAQVPGSQNSQVEGESSRKSAIESFDVLKNEYFDLGRMFVNGLKNTETTGMITAGVAAVIVSAVGFLLWRLVSAAATSALGTLYIFTGMIVMLLQKGSAPITIISQKCVFYESIAVFMIIFGTLTGVMLCSLNDKQGEGEEIKRAKND